jgi:hypothetical protein
VNKPKREGEKASAKPSEEGRVVLERLHWQVAQRDECCIFPKDLDMLEAFAGAHLPGAKRMLVPTVQCVLLGGESMNEWPCVLCRDLALMELIGFNAHHCENGLTTRGDACRKAKKTQGPIRAHSLNDESNEVSFT